MIERQHAVGRRRENKNTRTPVEEPRRDGLLAARLLDDFPESLDLVEYDEMRLEIVEQNALSSTAENPDDPVTAPPAAGIVRLKLIDLICQHVGQHESGTIDLDRLAPFFGNPLLQTRTKFAVEFQSQD